MPRVYCGWSECTHNRRGRCKSRSISMEDHYHTPTCDNYEGEWLEPWPVREKEAKRVSDKIMKAMLERMNADLSANGRTVYTTDEAGTEPDRNGGGRDA